VHVTTGCPAAKDWHSLPGAEAVEALATSASTGLSAEEVARRRERFGSNALPEAKRSSLVAVFARQLASPLIYLLLAAAALALVLGETSDAVVISVVVLLNAVIGAYQEGRAEAALAALRSLASAKARVVRDGAEAVIDARDLVPGDILILAAGDAVEADARLVDGAALQIAEAALTGESLPVGKDLVPVAPDTPLADRTSMVFAGTHVTAGRARAVVVSIGTATEIGRIASLAESEQAPKTPLARRVDALGCFVMVVSAAVFVAIVTMGWLRGLPLGEIAMIGIGARGRRANASGTTVSCAEGDVGPCAHQTRREPEASCSWKKLAPSSTDSVRTRSRSSRSRRSTTCS
jgi:Ca2+-transporting ATPase